MAIVTHKFRVSAASGFATTFLTDNMYLVLARPQSWDNNLSTNFTAQANGTVSDNNPPNPVDNWNNEFALWRDAMAAIKVNYSNISLVTRRYNWQYATRYDMYRHNINSSDPTANSFYDLSDSNFIVYVTSTGCVYKCLYNGRTANSSIGSVSTVMPTTTGTSPQTTGDGYIWKYMYTINASDSDFVTENYIPVKNTTNISNINGIDVVYVTNTGSGYTGTPTINIYGDGTGAAAIAVTSSSTVVRIDITAPGSGYTWAKIDIAGGGTPTTANAVAVIAPRGGHGSDPYTECMAHNVMIAGTVTGYEQTDFPVNQDFRTIALVKNPLTFNSSIGYTVTSTVGTLYTQGTARILRTLNMVATAITPPTVDAVISGSQSLATGLFVFQSSGTIRLEYIQPVNSDNPSNISNLRIDTSGNKKLYSFTSNETITSTGYSESVNSSTGITGTLPEIHPYTGSLLYLDYRQPVTRSAGQNEKINIVVNF